MNKHIKIIVLGLIILVSCDSKKDESTNQPAATASQEIKLTAEQKQNAGINLGEIIQHEMGEEVKCAGLVDVPPVSIASVSLPIAGYVKSTFELLPGKKVSKGQVLATINSLDYIQMQQEYLQAVSALGLSNVEKSRQQVLNNEEVGSKKKLQQAEVDQVNLQTQVKALGLKLEVIGCDMKALAKGNINAVLSVKSPIEGYIEEQYLAIGKYVTPADILVQIVGTLDKHVELKVFERDLSKLKLGQTILVESEGIRAKAKIFLIGQQVNLETRTTSVHGHFEKISDEKLFTVGQFISAKITVGSKSVSAVPQAALARVGKAGFIYFESSNGTIKQIPVEIISSTKDLVGIKPLVSLPEGKLVISGASALEAIFAKD
jgi:cobalt-zinc-cadmium efflux system membrane fusion protein